jgi:hypothetical protein
VFSAAFILDQADSIWGVAHPFADTTNRGGAPSFSRTLRKGASWQHPNRPRARPEFGKEIPALSLQKRRDKGRAPSVR